jgi:hypothetical protein
LLSLIWSVSCLDLLNRPEPVTLRRSSRKERRTTGPLPRNLVSLTTFAQLHGVAETKVQTHVDISLLPAKRGAWTARNGTVVTLALDANGRKAFYQLYHDFPFLRAAASAHMGIWTLSRQRTGQTDERTWGGTARHVLCFALIA